MSKEPMEFLKHIADECNYLLSVHNNISIPTIDCCNTAPTLQKSAIQ
jgi:hypothetical protein